MSLERRSAILAAILGVTMPNGCVVVDDPQHCANRDGDKTCAELYAAGVRCSTCERFYNGCVDDEPEPGCGVDDDEASESSEEDGSSTDRAELECDDCPEDAGALEAVR